MAAGNIATILMEPGHNRDATQVTKVKYCEADKCLFQISVVCENQSCDCLSWTVAVTDFHLITGRAEPLLDFFRDHHRAVLTSGTAEANRQVALALVHVVRNQ